MPKVAYSEAERAHIRAALVASALSLMAEQGIQHTTVEQIYKKAGISRTFFYSFFPTKEDLIVEALYLQQPRIIAYAQRLMDDPALSWRDAVRQFLHACCYGEKHGIAVLTIEEQQALFRRLSGDRYQLFREKQRRLFGQILETFGIAAGPDRIDPCGAGQLHAEISSALPGAEHHTDRGGSKYGTAGTVPKLEQQRRIPEDH